MKVCPKCGTQYGDDANFCTADAGRLVPMAASAPEAAPATSGLLGGRFQLGPRLGGDATGSVHRATDTQSGATVAVKLVAPAVLAQPSLAQRVERELKLLERVQTPHVARVLASGKQGDQLWVASEYVEGGMPLAAQVEAGLVDLDRAGEIVAAVGAALLDAAKVGVVHRDLSPKNVLVAGQAVKLINFALPMPGERVPGAPAFVAPEAIEGKPIDQRSTTYSLGALTYYMLTGRPPFDGDAAAVHAAHLSGGPPPPSTLAGVPTGFDAVIGKAMDRTPARRYLTLKQFLDDVRRAGEGGIDPSTTAPFGRVGRARESSAPPSSPRLAATELSTPSLEIPTVLGGPPPAESPVAAIAASAPATFQASAPAAFQASAPAAPTAFDETPSRRSPAPTIQAAAVPPPAHLGADTAVDDSATVRTPTLSPEEIAGAAEVPSPWAPPAAAQASPAGAMAANVPQAGVAPEAVPSGDVGPTTAAVQAMMRPAATAVEPPAERVPPPEAAVTDADRGPRAEQPRAAEPSRRGKDSAQPAPQAGGKRKPEASQRKAQKGKFRETLWFKKGDLDAAVAAEAAATADATAADKADTLPIEERYADDGTVTTSDAQRYSLKTGQTVNMPAIRDDGQPATTRVGEDELIDEMKGGRKKLLIAIAIAVVLIVIIILATTL